ncbi:MULTISPECIES: 2-polyprenyl-3-methyl-6-methoxy-1,4-benzoquinone monooxygenase [unclassified Wenzhouxiangella]|uniref:2-polyprenyl-3-methyl-6-methoxy-1,4-benzoquinone monooxygenase n=1 Tax=unclassified Wenzhouxiangella TaxID=2613841 RepID=UPI000E32BA18|nr:MULTISPECIES: 2-polyprenyl-3-methyl-6-methoxy-1,4-benzoquinone monooxygenase [unclassified Wenzhouxiangella]RFF28120.1 2-polyprenyl-3-methyl-6-methoxy-1,4-benzoquinone monooxygenase [Wenzhouxiangella sp. 15181]RFP68083.1 2-polyprenyl-3-methyl-6-methoxy-1,4-benzoquinone monooxygenase [Wenzhouxiangella sp. 15190]
MRQLTPVDHLFGQLDDGLRAAFGPAPSATRPSPAENLEEADLGEDERRLTAGLMRINHTGEVCAQALYAGQAATARSEEVREQMAEAALEEEDHLAWCAERLEELASRPSLFNPLWYAGSFSIGAAAGLAGDPWSLGFVEATERQVEAHLDEHLDRLPPQDQRSRAIVSQMKEDEARHAQMALDHGATILPPPVQHLMSLTAGIMKAVAYRI